MPATQRDRFLHALSRIHPRFGRQYMDIIMKTGASASSTFLSDVSIWLTEGLGVKASTEIMKLYLNLNDGSFQMHRVKNNLILTDAFGPPEKEDHPATAIGTSSFLGGTFSSFGAPPTSEEELDIGVEEGDHEGDGEIDENGNTVYHKKTKETMDLRDTSWIIKYDENGEYYKLPVLEGDVSGLKEGTIFATVQVEDQLAWIKSKGSSLKWWDVREFRPHARTVLLENCLKKGEYKEVHLIQLFGAFVRRTNIYRKDPFDMDSEAEHDICFQLPQPDFNALQKCLLDTVHECEQAEIEHPIPSKVQAQSRAAGKVSTLIKSVWNREKDEQLKAKLLVQDLDSSVAVDREAWLTVGRMLRLLSRGGTELLQPWSGWTKKYSNEIKAAHGKATMATGCKNAWDAFRPHTNCDDVAVVNLRSFFKIYDFSSKHSGEKILAENTVCLSLADIKKEILGEINPRRQAKMLRQMEEVFAVAESVDTKEISFLSSVLDPSLSGVKSSSSTTASEEDPRTYVATEEFSIDINASQATEPIHVEVGSIAATIVVGDMIRLPKLSKFNKNSGKSVSEDWFKIVDVDIIFARIRIVTCYEPPLCWIEKTPKDMLPFWIPIANLWNILVIRTMSSVRKVDTTTRLVNGHASYRSFLTPMDFTPEYALAYISSLPCAPKVYPPSMKDPKSTYKIDTKVLQTNPDSMVIAWNLQSTISKKYLRSDSEREMLWIVSICPALYNPDSIMPWKEIYKGTGEACQISSLVPSSQYQIKVEVRIKAASADSSSSVQLFKYGLYATLAEKPISSPDVYEWFVGASYGTVRLVGHAAPFETKETHHTIPIPEGCCYVFEIYMREILKNPSLANGEDNDEERDEEGNLSMGKSENNDLSNFTDKTTTTVNKKEKNNKKGGYGDSPFDELFSSRDAAFQGSFQIIDVEEDDIDQSVPLPQVEGKDGWEIIGRCRCGRLNSVVSISRYRNPVIWLRTRILNQEGLASEPSDPLVFKLSNL